MTLLMWNKHAIESFDHIFTSDQCPVSQQIWYELDNAGDQLSFEKLFLRRHLTSTPQEYWTKDQFIENILVWNILRLYKYLKEDIY